MAIANGFGGGVLRDVLIGQIPPVALMHARYVVIAVLCAVVCFFAEFAIRRYGMMLSLVDFVDGLGMTLFATVGASIALALGFHPAVAVLLGSVNAVAGGVFRDLINGVAPDISQPGPITAFAGLVTAATYVVFRAGFDLTVVASQWLAIGIGYFLRVLAIVRGTSAPTPLTSIKRDPSKYQGADQGQPKSQETKSQEKEPEEKEPEETEPEEGNA
jgi:uncharacterized membrane protein YeiH